MDPLDYLVEQLWSPLVETGWVRVDVAGSDQAEWVDAETYWAVPDLRRAKLLVPRGDRTVTVAAIENYRGLRVRSTNVMRAVVGGLTRYGVPVLRSPVSLQVHRDHLELAEQLPLATLRRALGRPDLQASIGIRTGDNRKPTLALVGGDGEPVGYAKVGWDGVTDGYVRTETEVLRRIGGGTGAMRAPGVLAETTYHDHPVLVLEPLPGDVRGGRSGIAPPTSDELYALTPVVRSAPPSQTRHLRVLAERLRGLASDSVAGPVVTQALPLLEAVERRTDSFPVAERWHGDLTWWNRARDAAGQLWVWDWETSEEDTVAGLDALHWTFSEQRSPDAELLELDLAACLEQARPHLTAAGLSTARARVVGAVYALVVVERACSLAAHQGEWSHVWISVDDLRTLLGQAQQLIAELD